MSEETYTIQLTQAEIDTVLMDLTVQKNELERGETSQLDKGRASRRGSIATKIAKQMMDQMDD